MASEKEIPIEMTDGRIFYAASRSFSFLKNKIRAQKGEKHRITKKELFASARREIEELEDALHIFIREIPWSSRKDADILKLVMDARYRFESECGIEAARRYNKDKIEKNARELTVKYLQEGDYWRRIDDISKENLSEANPTPEKMNVSEGKPWRSLRSNVNYKNLSKQISDIAKMLEACGLNPEARHLIDQILHDPNDPHKPGMIQQTLAELIRKGSNDLSLKGHFRAAAQLLGLLMRDDYKGKKPSELGSEIKQLRNIANNIYPTQEEGQGITEINDGEELDRKCERWLALHTEKKMKWAEIAKVESPARKGDCWIQKKAEYMRSTANRYNRNKSQKKKNGTKRNI